MALDLQALSLPGQLRSKGLSETRENEELRKLTIQHHENILYQSLLVKF